MSAELRYAAFISYSHKDRKWAEWLHHAIETFRIPKDFTGRSLKPVFLDRAELPSSSDLAASVRESLTQSRHLIVICSPDAARSRWVNEEVRTFKALGGADRILCLIVAGEPSMAAPGVSADDCFPPALRFTVVDGELTATPVSEPLAADVRPGKDDKRAARLKIIAGLLGVPLDRLVQREQSRRQRRLAIIATASALGCVAFGVLATVALIARSEAEHERQVAEQSIADGPAHRGFPEIAVCSLGSERGARQFRYRTRGARSRRAADRYAAQGRAARACRPHDDTRRGLHKPRTSARRRGAASKGASRARPARVHGGAPGGGPGRSAVPARRFRFGAGFPAGGDESARPRRATPTWHCPPA